MIGRNNFTRIGSTYDHEFSDSLPTECGREEILERLSMIYSGNIEVIGHMAGIRPATFDRRPFIGFHNQFPNVGIFNGFGAKGVSLVPYFASSFVKFLQQGSE